MYADGVKRFVALRAGRNAAIGSSWGAVAVALLCWYGYGEGWFRGGVVDGQPFLVAGIGYLLGAFLGWVLGWAPYADQDFALRELELEEVRLTWEGNLDGMRTEAARFKRAALLWNAFIWPFTLIYRILRAYTRIPSPP